jgi:hypothetical protein
MENGSTEQERSLALLHQQQEQLKRTIDVTTDIIKWRQQMALGHERVKRGRLSLEEEASIRSESWRDKMFLDSLYIDLDKLTIQIASLTPTTANTG